MEEQKASLSQKPRKCLMRRHQTTCSNIVERRQIYCRNFKTDKIDKSDFCGLTLMNV